jgi:hypothetical protein
MGQANPNLGSCCCCGKIGPDVRNVLMLHFKAPSPGNGCWGCFQCGLPSEGAVAVLCDGCLEGDEEFTLKTVVDGDPADNVRVPLEGFEQIPFGHDMTKHPEA